MYRWKIVFFMCSRICAIMVAIPSISTTVSRENFDINSRSTALIAIDRSTNKRLPVFHTYIHTSITIGIMPREFSAFLLRAISFSPETSENFFGTSRNAFFNSLCILSSYKRRRPRLDFGLLRAVILPWNGFS